MFASIDGRARLRELDDQRRAADDDMRRLFHNVVRLRTLLMLKARITRRVDSALQMFLVAIRRIGKGTGKSAVAAQAGCARSDGIVLCCRAVLDYAHMANLRKPSGDAGSFDLVIFDEASQSDIGAMTALLRAKKVLVVGDDKQVSPTAAFIEEQKTTVAADALSGRPALRRSHAPRELALRIGARLLSGPTHHAQGALPLRRADHPLQLPVLYRGNRPCSSAQSIRTPFAAAGGCPCHAWPQRQIKPQFRGSRSDRR